MSATDNASPGGERAARYALMRQCGPASQAWGACSPGTVMSWPWSAARCGTCSCGRAARRPRLDHGRPPGAVLELTTPGPTATWTVGHRLRHGRARKGRGQSRSPPTAASRTTASRASRRSSTAPHSRTTWSAGTSPSTRWRRGCRSSSSSIRRRPATTWRAGAAHARDARGSLRRRPAADDARGPVRGAAGLPVAPDVRAAMTEMAAAAGDRLRRADRRPS